MVTIPASGKTGLLNGQYLIKIFFMHGAYTGHNWGRIALLKLGGKQKRHLRQ
jgi:hypothetical protein